MSLTSSSSNQGSFNSNVGFNGLVASEFQDSTVFTIILFSIIIAWLIIDILNRLLFNLTYNTMGMNVHSTWHSFLILLVITVFFIAAVWVIDRYGLVPGGLSGQVESIDAPAVDVGTSNVTANNTDNVLDPRNGAFVSG